MTHVDGREKIGEDKWGINGKSWKITLKSSLKKKQKEIQTFFF